MQQCIPRLYKSTIAQRLYKGHKGSGTRQGTRSTRSLVQEIKHGVQERGQESLSTGEGCRAGIRPSMGSRVKEPRKGIKRTMSKTKECNGTR